MISLKSGDLLSASEEYICHQCNCVTWSAAGLAATIFAQYPEANIYKLRRNPSRPGTIDIRNRVINMFAQNSPGKAQAAGDGPSDRLQFFRHCLEEIRRQLPHAHSFAFPWGIGCGLAGGNWEDYLRMLTEFSESDDISVVIYRRED